MKLTVHPIRETVPSPHSKLTSPGLLEALGFCTRSLMQLVTDAARGCAPESAGTELEHARVFYVFRNELVLASLHTLSLNNTRTMRGVPTFPTQVPFPIPPSDASALVQEEEGSQWGRSTVAAGWGGLYTRALVPHIQYTVHSEDELLKIIQ